MDRHAARSLLRERLGEYRRLLNPELAARVGSDERGEVVRPSGVRHQTELQVVWAGGPGGAVRELGCIDDGRGPWRQTPQLGPWVSGAGVSW